EGVHEPIILEEQFDRVQALLARHPPGKNAGKAKESLFGSFITCGKCGELYTAYSYRVKNQTKGDYYVRSYICRARRFPSEYDEKCFNETMKNDIIESLFLSELQGMITMRRSSTAKPKQKKNYDLMIRRVEERINRLIDLYSDGDIEKEVLRSKIGTLNEEKKALLKKQSSDIQGEKIHIDLKQLDDYIIDFSNFEFTEKRAIVEKVLDGIIVNGNSITFEWAF
ncbi:zinc ribbon domain-containing protein, partial [Microvirga sp. 3-52]|nr:zinc ribbon domain-containing protein [Microvirga sp. 3-52]